MFKMDKIVILILLLSVSKATGDLEATFARCCALGANWAKRKEPCSKFSNTMEEETLKHQPSCLLSASICCLSFYREEQCEIGKQNAKEGVTCSVSEVVGGEYKKDCCDGCKLGLIAGDLGMKCAFDGFNFGFPWNEAYQECCLQSSTNQSTNSSQTEEKDVINPDGTPSADLEIPDSENLCLRFPGQLCSHICIPTKGSYLCECRDGFSLSPDKKSCTQEIPDNRCRTHNPCEQICRDTGISIECSCRKGLQLGSDQKTCIDIDECYLGTHNCIRGKQVCYNQVGFYICVNPDGSSSTPVSNTKQGRPSEGSIPRYLRPESKRTYGAQGFQGALGSNKFLSGGVCPPGYTFNMDSRACDDIDECIVGPDLCGYNIVCENTIGSYTCQQAVLGDCPEGFVFDITVQTCIDIDECTDESSTCGAGQYCINTQGGYDCQKSGGPSSCPAGYKYNEEQRTCEDVNECEEELHGCHPEAEKCRNVIGAYECDLNCGDGFQYLAIPRSCVDIDECLQDEHTCKPGTEICINLIGSFRCKSRAGNDILPFDFNSGISQAGNIPLKKIEFENSLVKECPDGYAYDLSSDQCLDVDECRAEIHNCSSKTHSCMNTLGGYICINKNLCLPGYKGNEDTGMCEDIDECQEGKGRCMPGQICVNTIGTFQCQVECREGFNYDPRDPAICVDVDECLQNPCKSGDVCLNTEGSYTCKLRIISCQTGYENVNGSCVDINECAGILNHCSGTNEVCRNTPGSYDCVDISCSRGFVRKSLTEDCEDVNECENSPCRNDEECINTPGHFLCRRHPSCLSGFRRISGSFSCIDIDECKETEPCGVGTRCVNTRGSYSCRSLDCPSGYNRNENSGECEDVDECETGEHNCTVTGERCINSRGTYSCAPLSPCPMGFKRDPKSFRCIDLDECAERLDACILGEQCINQYGRYKCTASPFSCQAGYVYYPHTKRCKDIDECKEGIHLCDTDREQCVNMDGDYKCTIVTKPSTTTKEPQFQIETAPPDNHCNDGYLFNTTSKSCTDLNECQIGTHKCSPSQRCDNTHGSYTCTRVAGCGTGYTLNQNTGKCEDDNECMLKTNDCAQLGPKWVCINTKGSFRCEKKQCPNDRILNSWGNCVSVTCTTGFKPQNKICVDINECKEIVSTCQSNEKCINTVGSYMCLPKINCGRGYKMNEFGTQCIDINECEGNKHICEGGQLCINRPGGYLCQCPKGFRLDINRSCKDVNECQEYRTRYQSVCGFNAVCSNTIGSYECTCKPGFAKTTDGNTCTDVNECTAGQNICQHKCTNIWGSHFCSCNPGYKLRPDNRTCSDIDECEEMKGKGKLCIGLCVNTPGTFRCSCPQGYRLDPDKRTCKDIDECEGVGVCHTTDKICINTRGGYKCKEIICPEDYEKDPTQRNRCKKGVICDGGDFQCRQKPMMYSYNFLPLASNMTLRSPGEIDLFTMSGPVWSSTNVYFDLELDSVDSEDGVPQATRGHFKLNRTTFNQVVLVMVKSVIGPQEVTLILNMKLYHNGFYEGTAISKLTLFVSQYDF